MSEKDPIKHTHAHTHSSHNRRRISVALRLFKTLGKQSNDPESQQIRRIENGVQIRATLQPRKSKYFLTKNKEWPGLWLRQKTWKQEENIITSLFSYPGPLTTSHLSVDAIF